MWELHSKVCSCRVAGDDGMVMVMVVAGREVTRVVVGRLPGYVMGRLPGYGMGRLPGCAANRDSSH